MQRDLTSPLGSWQGDLRSLPADEIERYRREAFRFGVFDISLDDKRLTDGERRTLISIG